MKPDPDYLKLLKLLMDVTHAVRCRPEPAANPVPLVQKFFLHAASFYYLSFGTKIPEVMNHPDVGSLNMIARSACELCVKFHHIFIDARDQVEREFRYFAWKLNGELNMQRYLKLLSRRDRAKAEQQRFDQERKHNKENIEKLKKKLQSNRCFLDLCRKHQCAILTNARFRKYVDTSDEHSAVNAGFHKDWSIFYDLLSDHVHSGGLSTLSIWKARTLEEQERLFEYTPTLVKVAMASMIEFYIKLFPEAESAVSEDAERFMRGWAEVRTGSFITGEC